jgi:hypothetical protein
MKFLFLISFILMFLLAPVHAWASIAADLLNLQSDLNVIKDVIKLKPPTRNPKPVSPPTLHEEHRKFIKNELEVLDAIDISDRANKLIEKGVIKEEDVPAALYGSLIFYVVPKLTEEEFKGLRNAIPGKYVKSDSELIGDFRYKLDKFVGDVKKDFNQKSYFLSDLKKAGEEFDKRVPVDLQSKEQLISAVLPKRMNIKEFEQARKNEFSDPQYPEPTRQLLKILSQKIDAVWEAQEKENLAASSTGLAALSNLLDVLAAGGKTS